MKIALIGRIAGALGLTLALTGCIDMTQDLTVTSTTTAKAVMTMTMGSDIYAMVKASNASDSTKAEDKFCAKEGEELTENADGSATCTSTEEGSFTDLKFDEGGSKPVFTAQADGTVRVAIPTKDMMGEMGKEDDPQTKEMMKQLFENHFLTLKIGGSEVIDTNMTLADDKKSAETKIAFMDLINGTAQLPEELYAVVQP